MRMKIYRSREARKKITNKSKSHLFRRNENTWFKIYIWKFWISQFIGDFFSRQHFHSQYWFWCQSSFDFGPNLSSIYHCHSAIHGLHMTFSIFGFMLSFFHFQCFVSARKMYSRALLFGFIFRVNSKEKEVNPLFHERLDVKASTPSSSCVQARYYHPDLCIQCSTLIASAQNLCPPFN